MTDLPASDCWYTATGVPLAHLHTVLKDSRLKWVYAERMDTTTLTWLNPWLTDTDVPFAAWLHGRAFGPALEIAWWRNGALARVRAIIEGNADQAETVLPTAITWKTYPTPDFESLPPQRHLLVGERDPNAETDEPKWSSARIARYLAYPISGDAARVALVERVYHQHNCIVARRLMQLEAVAATIR